MYCIRNTFTFCHSGLVVATLSEDSHRDPESSFFWFWVLVFQAVAEPAFCHPEFISGSHNLLILLDAETSSA